MNTALQRIVWRLQRAWYFHPRPQDVFLASFPRSGITWVRTIFGALIAKRPIHNILELDYIAPEEEVLVSRWRMPPSSIFFVKTHAALQWGRTDFAQAKAIIYLVRDPRDVVRSHYGYMQSLYGYKGEISAFVDDWLSGRIFPCSWTQHVRSWIDPSGSVMSAPVLIVRYEDFKRDCIGEMVRVSNALKLPYSSSQISIAAEQATLREMKLKESRGMRARETKAGYAFINQGRTGDWKGELPEEALARLETECGQVMQRLGYSPSNTS
jgi:hypothetical protein